MKELLKKTLDVAGRFCEILAPDEEELKRIAARYLEMYHKVSKK